MKIVITGGAGFIGSNLTKLIEATMPETEVVIFDDLSSGSRLNVVSSKYEVVEGSILDVDLLQRVTEGADAIVHLAAIPSVPRSIAAPMPTHDANATGTLNVLEAARRNGVDYVVVASSSSVYGSNPDLPKDELAWTRPMSPYAVSKLATEAYTNAFAYSYGMKTLAFRFFNVYGPGQAAGHAYAAVIPRFLEAAMSGEKIVIYGDGEQSRDFTFVGTVCAVLLDAVVNQVTSPDPVNLAFGTRTTLNELHSAIADILGRRVDVSHVDARVGDVYASQARHERLNSLFPSAAPTALDQGLRETIAWFEAQLNVPASEDAP
jgi:UDP-glucose 4-epimerase